MCRKSSRIYSIQAIFRIFFGGRLRPEGLLWRARREHEVKGRINTFENQVNRFYRVRFEGAVSGISITCCMVVEHGRGEVYMNRCAHAHG